jgi:magnesium chelatase family protein
VKAAVLNSNLPWPSERRITVGLSPASVHKRGAFLDLGIALAILRSHGAIGEVNDAVAIGELALDGQVRPVRGVLMAALAVQRAGASTILVPHSQVSEAQLVPDLKVVGVSCLNDAVAWCRGEHFDVEPIAQEEADDPVVPDLSDVRGQAGARIALEIAAAGGHHLGFMGSPGVGKTMLAERLPGILPPLDDELAVEVTAIHSVTGTLIPGQSLMRVPPFQAPHHTATTAALIGGGSHFARVGMVTLAHGGVLCLDEAAEFNRTVLDSLRQPMESGVVTIARTGFQAQLPARFQLVMASNPCPCGKFVGTGADCSCTSLVRRRYFSRLSGPLLDRIDIRVTLDRPTLAQLQDAEVENSATVAARVLLARERATARYQKCPWKVNAHVPGPYLRRHFPLKPDANDLLNRDAVKLSLRGADRVMRVAWTIADLRGHDQPTVSDVAAALTYRDGNGAWQAA